jgi:hypothetical protein
MQLVMMHRGFPYLAIVAAAEAQVQTWTSTSYVSNIFSSTVRVSYGATPVTPVPTSTAYSDGTSYINEPVTSSDFLETSWVTVTSVYPTATNYVVVYNDSLPDPRGTVTSSSLIATAWTSPILATITLSTTSCAHNRTPVETVTKYTGKFHDIYPGQVTTLPSSWPTSVVSIYNETDIYARYTYTGTTITETLTEIDETWISTIILTTTLPSFHGRNPPTTFLTTLTTTSSDWQLLYTTTTLTGPSACVPTPTVTRAAQCAPTNMLSIRDGYGVEIYVNPNIWRFPIGFNGEIIGIPGLDAGGCCQLCLDNKWCAVSQWTSGGTVNPEGCTLYYFGPGNASTHGTCGKGVELEYYASTWDQPGQGSYLALGCGGLEYISVHDDIF